MKNGCGMSLESVYTLSIIKNMLLFMNFKKLLTTMMKSNRSTSTITDCNGTLN